MRRKSNWKAVQILSETEDEKLLLEKFFSALPQEPEPPYYLGKIRIIDDKEKICEGWLLDENKIGESNIMIEIER